MVTNELCNQFDCKTTQNNAFYLNSIVLLVATHTYIHISNVRPLCFTILYTGNLIVQLFSIVLNSFMKKKYMFDNYIINRTQKQHKKERNEKKKNDTEIDMRIISSSLPVCLKLFILDLSLNDLSCDVLFYLKLHQICYCLRFDKKNDL